MGRHRTGGVQILNGRWIVLIHAGGSEQSGDCRGCKIPKSPKLQYCLFHDEGADSKRRAMAFLPKSRRIRGITIRRAAQKLNAFTY